MLPGHVPGSEDYEMKEIEYVYNDPEAAAELPHHLDRVWTVAECAQIFGLDVSTVRRACERKQVLARKSGATWLISVYDAQSRWNQNS
jgi:hypothetical protein